MTSASEELVPLRGGVTLPLRVIAWSIEIESRGCRLRAEPDGRLVVSPSSKLTDADRRFMAEHKLALLQVVAYCERAAESPV